MHTICIDFGTSSLRAALRKQQTLEASPLAIAPAAQIDNASIPSAIFVSKDGATVLFGDQALAAGLSRQPRRLFERSPKAWLNPGEVTKLDQPAGPDVAFSRRVLLAALLTLAVQASSKAAQQHGVDPNYVRYRISHPVWIAADKEALLTAYNELRLIACNPKTRRMRFEQTSDVLRRWYDDAAPDIEAVNEGWDVDEPIAAALDLIPDPQSDERRAALLVDVGAGTIDLGLFISVVPHLKSPHRRKLIRMCDPRSLFSAGDVIDRALIDLMVQRLGNDNHQDLSRFRNDIRRNKETLFDEGRLSLARVTLTRDELVETDALKTMAHRLRTDVQEMLAAAAEKFAIQLGSNTHPIQDLDVVFAGGGARLAFLRDTIDPIVTMGKARVKACHLKIDEPKDFGVDASRARMAVALGGTTPLKEWPVTEMKPRS